MADAANSKDFGCAASGEVAGMENLLHRPALSQSLIERRESYANKTRPLGGCQALSAKFKVTAAPPVIGLFSLRRPSAIGLGIGAVIVDSVKFGAAGTWPHVSNELREVIPRRADRDAAAAIGGEGGVAGVATTATHLGPDALERMTPPTNAEAVRAEIGTFSMHACILTDRFGASNGY